MIPDPVAMDDLVRRAQQGNRPRRTRAVAPLPRTAAATLAHPGRAPLSRGCALGDPGPTVQATHRCPDQPAATAAARPARMRRGGTAGAMSQEFANLLEGY